MMLLRQLRIFRVQMEGGRKLSHSPCGLRYYSLSVETNENADVVRTLQFFLHKRIYKWLGCLGVALFCILG